MPSQTVIATGSVQVLQFRCDAGVGAPPVREWHPSNSLGVVLSGTFGYHAGARRADMIAGGTVIGRGGDEYVCTHEHRCGDTCLSFRFSPAREEELGLRKQDWQTGGIGPVKELGPLAGLAASAVAGTAALHPEEAAMLYAATFARVVAGREIHRLGQPHRARLVEAALWMERNSAEPFALEDAAGVAGLSPFHFLRSFRRSFGVTPHQYTIAARLRRAAALLAEPSRSITEAAFAAGFGDLSNFIASFRGAFGVSPRRYRAMSRGDRALLQARLRTVLGQDRKNPQELDPATS